MQTVVAVLIAALVIFLLQVVIGREATPRSERLPLRSWRPADVWRNAALGRRSIADLLALQARQRERRRAQPIFPPHSPRRDRRPDGR